MGRCKQKSLAWQKEKIMYKIPKILKPYLTQDIVFSKELGNNDDN
jgi:hypothetical protein